MNNRQKRAYLIFFALITIEGTLAFISLFLQRSMDKNAIIFGYSKERILFALFVLLIVGFFGIMGIQVFREWKPFLSWNNRISQISFIEKYNYPILISLLVASLVAWSVFIFWSLPFNKGDTFWTATFNRAKIVILWFALIFLQAFILYLVLFPQSLSKRYGRKYEFIIGLVLALAFGCLSFIQWIILYYQLPIFNRIPGWFWYYWKKYGVRTEIFFLLLIISLIITWWILKRPAGWRSVFVLVLLGFVLQVGYGFVWGGGFQYFRDTIENGRHRNYAVEASTSDAFQERFLHYEDFYHNDYYMGTKPPGLLLIYITAEKLSNLINPVFDYESRYQRLVSFAAYVFPFVSFLTLFPLYALAKIFLDKNLALIPCLLYILLPNVLLMNMEMDQVLFPLLFCLGVYFAWWASNRGALWRAIIVGIYGYLAIFVTFSLLPILLFTALWFIFDAWVNRLERPLSRLFWSGCGYLIGFTSVAILFRFLLNYDFILRYTSAMEIHRSVKDYQSGLLQMFWTLILNNSEYITWISFGIAFLIIAQMIISIRAIVRNRSNSLDFFALDFVVLYVLLNFIGQTNGEVGRLWLFLTPVIAILVTPLVVRLLANRFSGVIYFVIIQSITIFLIFSYQGFF